MKKPGYKYCFLTIISLAFSFTAFSQNEDQQAFWKSLFNKPFDGANGITRVFWNAVHVKPKNEIVKIIQSLEADKTIANTNIGQGKLTLVKINYSRSNGGYYENTSQAVLCQRLRALTIAADDEYLSQGFCDMMGDIHVVAGNVDTAVFYLLKSLALAEHLGFNQKYIINFKIATSTALYHTQDYKQCIAFCKSSINLEDNFSPVTVVAAYNNTGVSYLKLGMPDSAMVYFKKEEIFCQRVKFGMWEGIASGNIGNVLHVQGRDAEAMVYWQKDYDSSIKYGEDRNAGLTLAYISEQQFIHGQQKKALDQLNWSVAVNRDNAPALISIYNIKSSCFRRIGLYDSADHYLRMEYHLSDSVNRVISQGNFNIVQLRLAYEKNTHEYQLLKKEREAEIIKRNLLLVALLSLALIVLLLYNRQTLKIKLAKQQQAIAEAEKDSAKEQLQIFTETLLKKNEQIEELSASLEQRVIATNDELIHQTLLTDYDWNRFKELFEKIHPDFFSKLKNIAPAVTQSEMRLAALIKLNLDNKQMASMQGISVSSLRGNKTRLRQKLNISVETGLEELLKQL